MKDANIVAACIQSREAYDRVKHHVETSEMTPMGGYWWKLVEDWYKRDPASAWADGKIIRDRGKRKAGASHRETMLGWYDELPKVSELNVVQELLELKRYAKGNEVANAIAGGEEGDKLLKLTTELHELLAATELGRSKIKWTEDDDEMHSLLDRGNRVPLAPSALNRRAGGGAVPGDHIVIFGRPEAGKTLFTVNMAAGFLKKGFRVLYIGNEESTYKTRARIICNLASCTPDQLDSDNDKAHRIARKKGLDLLRICHMEPGTIPEIEELLRDIRPDVLVVDQIRNISHSESKMTQRMEKVATELRALLAKYDVIGVSVTQAGDKTERHGQEPPPWLTMADVDSSRTGLPAQADLMIGLGSDDEMRNHNTRAVSLPKNKLGWTHDGFTVEVDTLRSKVK